MYDEPVFRAGGDQAVLVELGDEISPETNARVHSLARAIEEAGVAGVVDLVPAYDSLLVQYDATAVSMGDLQTRIVELDSGPGRAADGGRVVELPVLYGGEHGPDIERVAEHAGMPVDEVIGLHSGTDYLVYMLGFTPGFPYLGGLDDRLATPRVATPRLKIPGGSVGIAESQTGVYPLTSPRRLEHHRSNAAVAVRPDAGAAIAACARRPGAVRAAGRPRGIRRDGRGMSPAIEVIEPGLFTTVQDRGRYGFQRYGVPVSGAMDPFALRAANLLAGNDENAAALEMTVIGPTVEFKGDAVIAVTGADLTPMLDDSPMPRWEAVRVTAGSGLSFHGMMDGIRGYLAVSGGIDVPEVMGSRSTYVKGGFGGLNGSAISAGDVLDTPDAAGPARAMSPEFQAPVYGTEHELRVILGPQDDAFDDGATSTLLGSTFTVSLDSDRMGYRLEGPQIAHRDSPDIISEGNAPGRGAGVRRRRAHRADGRAGHDGGLHEDRRGQ